MIVTIVSRFEHADSLMQKDSVQSLILERSSIKRVWSHDTSIRQVEATLDTLRRRPPRQMKLKMDESQTREFEFLTQKLMISISEDLLNLDELNDHFKSELEHQGFDISFRINQEAFGQATSIGEAPTGNFLTTQATSAYLGESHSIGVDTLINKKLLAANNIFRYIRRGEVLAVTRLNNLTAEILEFEVKANSLVNGEIIRELDFPRDAIIGGVIRNGKGIIALGDFRIMEGDRVVVCSKPKAISKIEKLFR